MTTLHKSIRKPDEFFRVTRKFFAELSRHTQGLVALLVGVVILSAAAAFYSNFKEKKSVEGQDALYHAKKSLETQYSVWTKAEIPTVSPDLKNSKDSKKAAPVEQTREKAKDWAHEHFDVDAKLSGTVTQLKDVSEKYSSVRAGYESALLLGDLYLDHGDAAKALPWYQTAYSRAPRGYERAALGYTLGVTHENLGHTKESLEAYQKALNSGENALKPELLLAVARVYEATGDLVKAKNSYDEVLQSFPATEYSKTAELNKARLK